MNCVGDTKARSRMKYLKEHWKLGVVLQKKPLEAAQCAPQVSSMGSEVGLPGFNTALSSS